MNKYFVTYDIRGIQKYIFKTTSLQEISGASNIIRNILLETVTNYLKSKFSDDQLRLNWASYEDFEFINNDSIKAEIIYSGAGNLLLAYRPTSENEEVEIEDMNKYIQIEILKKTYNLSVACASYKLKDSDTYKIARDKVNNNLSDVKKRMSNIVLQKALPFIKRDPITGQPLSDIDDYYQKYLDFDKNKFIKTKNKLNGKRNSFSIESFIKAYKFSYPTDDESKTNKSDDFTTLDNDELNYTENNKTMLAIVHIDGNDMGAMISRYLEQNKSKSDSATGNKKFEIDVNISRNVSRKIMATFNDSIDEIMQDEKYRVKKDDKEIQLVRKVINSGDDITFICSANIAIQLTKEIIEEISKNYLTDDANDTSNPFSSCGGICFIHRHFPFYVGYEIAEELCSLAKVKAKKKNSPDEKTSSYLDFFICDGSIIKSVSELRAQNESLYIRPYLVTSPDETKNNPDNYYHVDNLLNILQLFREKTANKQHLIARSTVKEIRNTYEEDTIYSKMLFKKLESRDAFKVKKGNNLSYEPFIYDEENDKEFARYYDASVIYDLVYDIEKEDNQDNEMEGD